MAIKAISKREHFFVPENDPDKGTENETRFGYRMIDSLVRSFIEDSSMKFSVNNKDQKGKNAEIEQKASFSPHQMGFQAVQYGLTSIHNFRDEDGNDIPYETVTRRIEGHEYHIVKPEIVAMIPHSILMNLYERIWGDNTVDEEDLKNSNGQ